MKWFQGSIAEAVSTSKQKNAVFVVFIEGKDEASKTMTSALEKVEISGPLESSSFVSVKLDSGTESHQQFTEIYKLVPVPSVFFIGKNGTPLDIIAAEATNSVEGLVNKLIMAINTCLGNSTPVQPSNAATNSSATTSSSPPDNPSMEVSVDDSLLENPPVEQHEHSPGPTLMEVDVTNTVNVDKVERAKQLIEKIKEEKRIQEEKEQKERELKRRKSGQQVTEAKRRQQDRELQELRLERMKEKEEERLAKQRVLEQIAQDRINRAARSAAFVSAETAAASSSAASSSASTQPQARPTSPPADTNTARLQFKMPNGQTRTHSFPADTTLGQVRQFIDNNIVLPFREYHMATTFPRREFTARDNNLDLRSLQLLPSAVILIMPVQGNMSLSKGASWPRVLMDMVWDLLQPLISLSNYLMSWVSGRGATDASSRGSTSTATGPSSSSQPPPGRSSYTASNPNDTRPVVRKRGNIHSLADNDNSNDENNTWNGNSTQQM